MLQEPVPFAAPKPRPLPEPAPGAPRGPSSPPPPSIAPIAPPNSSLDPLPEPEPVPVEDPCAEQKAKKRKKRSDRAVCWKGTYVEKSRGISKTRRVRVDCMTGKELASAAPTASSSSRKRPRYNKPKVPGGLPLPDTWEVPST